jgi:AcrR family transcriptional regulator
MPPRRRPSPYRPLPATQIRSQETVERLLSAAEDALREDGVDGATLRAIADRAGVSLAIVYRRFVDKDSVLRAVYVRFFERSGAANAANLLSAGERTDRSPTMIASQLVAGMVAGYRANRNLLRALVLYARTHEDAEFRARAESMNADAFALVVDLFEPHFADMDHPDPRKAVRFAIAAIASLLQDCILFSEKGSAQPFPQNKFQAEVTRMFVQYLGLPSERAHARKERR